MLSKVYVGNLPFNATEDDVRNIFSRYGKVYSVNLATDRETGRSRGFGFVEMDGMEAKAALALDGTLFKKHLLHVRPARVRLLAGRAQKSSW